MILLSTLTVGAASAMESGVTSNSYVNTPWMVETWASDYSASNFSVAFGGSQEHILLNFLHGASPSVLAIPDDYFLGNCGPENGWSCFPTPQSGLLDKVSDMDTYTYINSFKVGWAYESSLHSNHIYLAGMEIIDSLDYQAGFDKLVVDLPYLMGGNAWSIFNAPSLAYDSTGRAHIALVIRADNNSADKLIYAHELAGGDTPTTPCNAETGTKYQCDFIYTTSSSEYLGMKPKIAMTASDRPRIGYTLRGADFIWRLMIAYPQTNVLAPSNCGPATAWHCLVIDESGTSFVINAWFEMAIGSNNVQFAYQVTNPNNNNSTWIYHAKYVGNNGNCGSFMLAGQLRYAWQCSQVIRVAASAVDQYFASFSIQVDPNDYPVIAHQYTASDLSPLRLELSYPSQRNGGAEGSWTHQVIDSGPYDTGRGVGLALNELGLGCLAYVEDIDYEPAVKLACQGPRALFLPSIQR